MIYRLDAMEAYNKRLVKKIAVKGITESGSTATESYVYLESINLSKAAPTATIQFDFKGVTGIRKITRTVSEGYNLYDNSGQMEEYKEGFVVSRIDGRDDSVEFINGIKLYAGDVIGKVSEDQLRRIQIRETILSHIGRERELFYKGIKVLSLFFIDEVAKYKQYDAAGQPMNGSYADMFEEEYRDVVEHLQIGMGEDEYIKYLSEIPAEKTHAGYFSIDTKGKLIDSKANEKRENTKEKMSNDVDAYDLIMKNKELLLDRNPKKSPVRFIFSHSALREGWDNPNVFQICTLVDTKDTFTKRQKIGRGLRLCVNQEGERITHEKEQGVNTLTVIANESYEEFASTLQSEIQEDCGIKFGCLEENAFTNIIRTKDDEEIQIGYEASKEIYNFMIEEGYISKQGKINEKLKRDIVDENVKLPIQYEDVKEDVISIVKKSTKRLPIENSNNRVEVKLRKRVFETENFKELWNRINQKTTYRVNFDDELFKSLCLEELENLKIKKRKINIDKADIEIERKGVEAEYKDTIRQDLKEKQYKLPDIIRELQDLTMLTRAVIIDILIKADKWDLFRMNPHQFIENVAKILNSKKKEVMVKGVEYFKIDEIYSAERFEKDDEDPLIGYLKRNAVQIDEDNSPSLYNYVVCDSDTEKHFVEQLEKDENVKLYIKLPGWFLIETPFGNYNPDWAILMEKDDIKKLYFVAETKGSLNKEDLRAKEDGKIKCARKHFKLLNEVEYDVVTSLDEIDSKYL